MKRLLILPLALAALLAGGAVRIVQDQCGPFTDVTPAFCPYVSELYYLGITAGTSATTFSPDDPLTRGQAAVFVAKGLNQSLARSSRRAALGQWWTPQNASALASTPRPRHAPRSPAADGHRHLDSSGGGAPHSGERRAATRNLDWRPGGVWGPGRDGPRVRHRSGPDTLYMIDPAQPAGNVSAVADQMGAGSGAISFDGQRLWTANVDSISIVTPGPTTPWSVTTVSTGFSRPVDVLFDGNSTWVADTFANALFRLDPSGAVAQTVPVGAYPNSS